MFCPYYSSNSRPEISQITQIRVLLKIFKSTPDRLPTPTLKIWKSTPDSDSKILKIDSRLRL